MKKNILFTVCIVLMKFLASAQSLKPVSIGTDYYSTYSDYPYHWTENKWGFVDTISGDTVIPCKFDLVEPFSEGLAYVSIGSTGACEAYYLDGKGNIVLSMPEEMSCPYSPGDQFPGYDHSFHDGKALVYSKKTDGYGIMDKTGELIFYCVFSRLGTFNEGLAYAAILGDKYSGYLQQGGGTTDDKIGYINEKGEFAFTLPEKYINRENGCYYYGLPFKNGKAKMQTAEHGADCDDGYHSLEVDHKGNIKEIKEY